jgi:hypothetical protein
VVHRAVTHTCHRIFHPAKPGHESPLIARQGQRPALYHAQAAAVDQWLAAQGIPPQMPLIHALKGAAAAPAPAAPPAPQQSISVAVTAGAPA